MPHQPATLAPPLLLLLACLAVLPAVDVAAPVFGYAATLTGSWTAMQGGRAVQTTSGPLTVRDSRNSLLLVKDGRLQSVQLGIEDIEEPVTDVAGLVRILERRFDSTALKLKTTAMPVDLRKLQADAAMAIRFEAQGPDDVFVRAAPGLIPVGDVLYVAKGGRALIVIAITTATLDRDGNPAAPVFPDADPGSSALFPFEVKR